MVVAVPSLSEDGFVTDIRKKADLVMAHYFASDWSQSNAFYTHITSLSYQVQKYGHAPNELRALIEAELERYLALYFETVNVTVSIEEPKVGAQQRYNIVLDVIVTQGEYRYSLGSLIEVQNNKIGKIINHFQNGT